MEESKLKVGVPEVGKRKQEVEQVRETKKKRREIIVPGGVSSEVDLNPDCNLTPDHKSCGGKGQE